MTAARIETALVDRGLPQPMASCMAVRMVDRLSLPQLRKLEQIGAQSGEDAGSVSTVEVLSRLRRIDDREAVEVTATSAAVCAFGLAVPPG
ncbi:MAG: hypothetical protein ACR2FJ_00150 [Qipengyuania sp.]